MSLISCDISVVVIIRKCHRCRAGPHIYLSDITLGHNSRIAHLTRWTFSDTCLFCGFSCNSCKLRCVWKISSQCYLIVFNIFLVMIIIVNINTTFNLGVYIFWMSFECIIHSICADFLPKKRLFLRQYTMPCARTQVESHANASA